MSAHITDILQHWTQLIHMSPIACSLSVWLHDGPFLHVNAHKWVWRGFDSSHGYTGREPDSGTIVMNSLLKLWSTAPPLDFFPQLLPLPFPSLTIFSVWWISFQPLSVYAISRRSCPILPQRHMCGDTDQRRSIISGQWALDACNTKPVMEVSPWTAIDAPWDCMSQNKQTNTNMLISTVWSWYVKTMESRTKS